MIVEVEITQDDIGRGKCKSASKCAAALAINKRLKSGTDCFVSPNFTSFINDGDDCATTIDTPPELKEFVRQFDYEQAKPCLIKIDIPVKYLNEVKTMMGVNTSFSLEEDKNG